MALVRQLQRLRMQSADDAASRRGEWLHLNHLINMALDLGVRDALELAEEAEVLLH